MCRRKSKGGWAFLISSASGRSPQLDRKCNEQRIRIAEIEREIEPAALQSQRRQRHPAGPTSTAGWPSSMRSARQLQTEAERLAHQEGHSGHL